MKLVWMVCAGAAAFTAACGRADAAPLNLAGKDYWQDASLGVFYEGAPRTVRLSVATDF